MQNVGFFNQRGSFGEMGAPQGVMIRVGYGALGPCDVLPNHRADKRKRVHKDEEDAKSAKCPNWWQAGHLRCQALIGRMK